MPDSDNRPILQINQNLIMALAVAGCVLAIVLYYENRKMREQLLMVVGQRRPCDCEEKQQASYMQSVVHSDEPSVMPNNQKPPEVVVD